MFYASVIRFQGTPFTSGSSLGGGSLLSPVSGETAVWGGDADSLMGSGLVAGPTSLQWIAYADEASANSWATSPGAQSPLTVSLLSGYDGSQVGSGNVVLLVHRWRAWPGPTPSMACARCPPALGVLPRWYGQLVAGKTPAPPVETWVLMFESLAALNTWTSSTAGSMFMNNSLYAIRMPTA